MVELMMVLLLAGLVAAIMVLGFFLTYTYAYYCYKIARWLVQLDAAGPGVQWV